MTTFLWRLSAPIDPGSENALTAAQRALRAAEDDAAVERVRSKLLMLIAADCLANYRRPSGPKAEHPD